MYRTKRTVNRLNPTARMVAKRLNIIEKELKGLRKLVTKIDAIEKEYIFSEYCRKEENKGIMERVNKKLHPVFDVEAELLNTVGEQFNG